MTFWLFGLSGAGKSTLADALACALRADGRAVLALDGDRLREGLCSGLGFSDADRAENLRRAAEVARLATESGLTVIAAFITPRETNRAAIAGVVGEDRVRFVLVTAPLEICRARDVKGLYARQAAGHVPQFTGISSAFEPPAHPHLALDTSAEPPAASAARLLSFARAELR
ncbi:MAG: adenylyl-sulfate kinase [Opitutae bacterium]|nr:adenylyl-sulfate kinase [Opitutae bacterium]